MMDFIKQNKQLSLLAAVILLGALFYAFFSSSTPAPLLGQTDAAPDDTAQFLASLSGLRTIQLDDKIFREAAFKSLSDFGVVIPPEDAGRRNPFLPLDGGGSAAASGVLPVKGQ